MIKFFQKLQPFLVIIMFLLLIPGLAFAVNGNPAASQPEPGFGIPSYLRPENLPTATRTTEKEDSASSYTVSGAQKIIGDIISILLLVAGGLAVYSIVGNAFWLIAAAGKEEQITQRKKGLMWSILGLIFVVLSYITIQFIVEFAFRVAGE